MDVAASTHLGVKRCPFLRPSATLVVEIPSKWDVGVSMVDKNHGDGVW